MRRKDWGRSAGLGIGMGLALIGLTARTGTHVSARPDAQESGITMGGVSGIQVQNLDPDRSATIASRLFPQLGGQQAVTLTSPNVPVDSAANVYLGERRTERGLFSGVVSSDRPIAAIARTDWHERGAAAIYANVRDGTHVVVPLIMIDYADSTSAVTIQNADVTQAVDVRIELRSATSPDVVLERGIKIAGGASVTLDMAQDPAFASVESNTPLGFLGSLHVMAATAVGVQSFLDIGRTQQAVSGFAGVPMEQAASRLYAPLIRRRAYGYDTGIAVSNPGAESVNVTVRYTGSGGTGWSQCEGRAFVHGPVEIAGGSSTVFYQGPGGGSGLPDRCVGSAVIEATGDVLAVVHDSLNFTESAAAYNAVPFAEGGTRVALPLIRRQHGARHRLTTGIQVMNIGDEVANVTLHMRNDQGRALTECGRACGAAIGPSASHTYYLGSGGLTALPINTFGSAVITADQPIIVLVVDASASGTIDMASYLGMPAHQGAESIGLPILYSAPPVMQGP